MKKFTAVLAMLAIFGISVSQAQAGGCGYSTSYVQPYYQPPAIFAVPVVYAQPVVPVVTGLAIAQPATYVQPTVVAPVVQAAYGQPTVVTAAVNYLQPTVNYQLAPVFLSAPYFAGFTGYAGVFNAASPVVSYATPFLFGNRYGFNGGYNNFGFNGGNRVFVQNGFNHHGGANVIVGGGRSAAVAVQVNGRANVNVRQGVFGGTNIRIR